MGLRNGTFSMRWLVVIRIRRHVEIERNNFEVSQCNKVRGKVLC